MKMNHSRVKREVKCENDCDL